MAVSPKSFDNNNNKWFYFYNLFKEIGGKKDFIAVSPMMDFSDEDYAVKMAFPIEEDHGCRRSKKKKFRRGFSKVITGAFFQASSTKKTKSKKAGDEGTSSPPSNNDDHSTKIQKTFKLKKPPPLNSSVTAASSGVKTRSDGSSSSSSSLCTLSNSEPSSMSSSRSTSARKSLDFDESNSNMMKNKSISLKKNCGGYYYNSNMGLYFLFISLVGLVFCGKAFAILCTATCLFLFNPRRTQVRHVDFIDFDFDPDHKHI